MQAVNLTNNKTAIMQEFTPSRFSYADMRGCAHTFTERTDKTARLYLIVQGKGYIGALLVTDNGEQLIIAPFVRKFAIVGHERAHRVHTRQFLTDGTHAQGVNIRMNKARKAHAQAQDERERATMTWKRYGKRPNIIAAW